MMGTMDAQAADDLKLYIDNDGTLYRQQTTSILKNLMAKRARGEYKHDLAVKAFGYLVEAGAKKYAGEFGSSNQPWNRLFDVSTRKQVAEELTRDFEAEAALGNYDKLLPKKYQGPKSGKTAHARKKTASSEISEFLSFLANASNSQIQGIYEKEKRAGRGVYARLAAAEADRRGLSLGGHAHARKKSAAPRASGPARRKGLTASDMSVIRSLAEQDRSGEVDDSYARTGDAQDTIQRWYAAAGVAGDADLSDLIDRVGVSAAARAYEAARGMEGKGGHARRKSGAQLDHEIRTLLGGRRYRV